MYSSVETQPISAEKFELGQLDHNRWVIMSELIPWSEIAQKHNPQEFAKKFIKIKPLPNLSVGCFDCIPSIAISVEP